MTDNTKYTLQVGIALVIANMIGTGVFTSLGYQVGPLPSGFVILMLWLLGGVVALSGALVYAEISTTLKRSGGEYYYLGEIFHPLLGFLSGWMSTLVGFAGAISAVALAIGSYSAVLIGLNEKWVAIASILLISFVHLFGVKASGWTQTLLTGIKLSLIAFFCIAPLFFAGDSLSGISFLPQPGDWDLMLTPGFAVSLVFVVYAYTGWNAAAYIAGNLENPARNLPLALLLGTGIVVVIYLSLNAMFLFVANFNELNGQNDVGNIIAIKLFGVRIGQIFSALFSIALLSTLSAMTIAGPRVTEAMGEDYPSLQKLSTRNRYGMPYVAVLIQAGWSVFLVMVSSFKEIIQYISISLSIFSLLTVIGIFFLRKTHTDRPFRMPFYPVTPLIFIVVTCWMIYYMFREDPKIIFYSLGTMIPGAIIYFSVRKK
ncbi:MAG: amino acid permease [Cyclobacteriaceae bacterium]|nr:amino acid permease [Cytophagales bacterium]HNP77815.1 amino acid permease [Cyclobacteriaceae bacterium]